jgi:hypothetical protein
MENPQGGGCSTGLGTVFPLGQAGDGGEGDVSLANQDFIAVCDPFQELAEAIFEFANVDGGGHGLECGQELG